MRVAEPPAGKQSGLLSRTRSMSEHTHIHSQPDGENVPVLEPAPEHSFWWKTWQVLKVAQARLRFIAIIAVIGLIVGFWDTINGYYEKWTRPLYGETQEAEADEEYF